MHRGWEKKWEGALHRRLHQRSFPDEVTTATTGDLDKCVANQSWLILVWHKFTTGSVTDVSTCSQSDFNAIIDAINAKAIPVIPVGDVLKHYG